MESLIRMVCFGGCFLFLCIYGELQTRLLGFLMECDFMGISFSLIWSNFKVSNGIIECLL